jgi:hypothetical protein
VALAGGAVAIGLTSRQSGHQQQSSLLATARQQYSLAGAAYQREMCGIYQQVQASSGPSYTLTDDMAGAEARYQTALSNINWPLQAQADARDVMNALTDAIAVLRSGSLSTGPLPRLQQAENVLDHDLGLQDTGATMLQACGGG